MDSFAELPDHIKKEKYCTKHKMKFSAEEDKIITDLVAKQGPKKWRIIAESLPNRTARQIRERWRNYLSPEVNQGPWSEEEENLLLMTVRKIGLQWSKISMVIKNRTDVAIKNHWIMMQRRFRKEAHKKMDKLSRKEKRILIKTIKSKSTVNNNGCNQNNDINENKINEYNDEIDHPNNESQNAQKSLDSMIHKGLKIENCDDESQFMKLNGVARDSSNLPKEDVVFGMKSESSLFEDEFFVDDDLDYIEIGDLSYL